VERELGGIDVFGVGRRDGWGRDGRFEIRQRVGGRSRPVECPREDRVAELCESVKVLAWMGQQSRREEGYTGTNRRWTTRHVEVPIPLGLGDTPRSSAPSRHPS
jgi:hypothetical protein